MPQTDFSPSICIDDKVRELTTKTITSYNRETKRGRDRERETGVLTLDVDGDAGLLAVGDRLVGGLTDDLLTCLDVGWRQVEGAHGALSPAVSQQGLQTDREVKSS